MLGEINGFIEKNVLFSKSTSGLRYSPSWCVSKEENVILVWRTSCDDAPGEQWEESSWTSRIVAVFEGYEKNKAIEYCVNEANKEAAESEQKKNHGSHQPHTIQPS